MYPEETDVLSVKKNNLLYNQAIQRVLFGSIRCIESMEFIYIYIFICLISEIHICGSYNLIRKCGNRRLKNPAHFYTAPLVYSYLRTCMIVFFMRACVCVCACVDFLCPRVPFFSYLRCIFLLTRRISSIVPLCNY